MLTVDKYETPYDKVIITGEKSAGMKIRTRSFHKTSTLEKVLDWAHEINVDGSLIITIDESSIIKK